MLKLGMRVQDKITGFVGVVTGLVDYISGCSQALLTPKIDDSGGLKEAEWFDVQRCVQVGGRIISLDNVVTPGPDREAPKR